MNFFITYSVKFIKQIRNFFFWNSYSIIRNGKIKIIINIYDFKADLKRYLSIMPLKKANQALLYIDKDYVMLASLVEETGSNRFIRTKHIDCPKPSLYSINLSQLSRVPIKDILWIDAAGDYMCVHALGETLVMRSTLRELVDKLDERTFARIHRSTRRVRRVRRAHRRGTLIHLSCARFPTCRRRARALASPRHRGRGIATTRGRRRRSTPRQTARWPGTTPISQSTGAYRPMRPRSPPRTPPRPRIPTSTTRSLMRPHHEIAGDRRLRVHRIRRGAPCHSGRP